VGGKLMTPVELQRIHRFILDNPGIEVISDEIRAVVEGLWPELVDKLPPKQAGEQPSIKKVSDYRKHVEECQALLRRARTPEEKQMLLSMAETWEGLAVAREKKLAKDGKAGDD
jgi:hypothetical protein